MLPTSHTITFPAEPGETPVTAVATVITVERSEERDFVGVRCGLSAQLEVAVVPEHRPRTYFLSRLVVSRCGWSTRCSARTASRISRTASALATCGCGVWHRSWKTFSISTPETTDWSGAIGRDVALVLTGATGDHPNLR